MEGVVVVTGANRGLGLGLVREFLGRGWAVAAACRNTATATALHALQPQHGEQLLVAECDVASGESVEQMARAVSAWKPSVDILINNAGVLLDGEERLSDVSTEVMAKAFDVNVLGPLRVTQALLPFVRKGREKKIVYVSSKMGSVALNTAGKSYSYRVSKSALTMLSKNVAVELRPEGIISLALHPGWAQTDMGGHTAAVPVDVSVQGMVQVVFSATMEQSGKLIDYLGNELLF